MPPAGLMTGGGGIRLQRILEVTTVCRQAGAAIFNPPPINLGLSRRVALFGANAFRALLRAAGGSWVRQLPQLDSCGVLQLWAVYRKPYIPCQQTVSPFSVAPGEDFRFPM